MGNYIYKCVPLSLEADNNQPLIENIVRTFENILNESAKDGWDFVKTDTISQPSFNSESNSNTSHIKILIFKKYIVAKVLNPPEINFVFNETELECPGCKNEIGENDFYCENCATKLN